LEVVNMTEQAPEAEIPARPPATRNTGVGKRARKFPLTLRSTGQFCKKIRGRIRYFGRAEAGEIRKRQYHEPKPRLKAFADFIGRDRLVAEIKTIELLSCRENRIEDGRAPVPIIPILNEISVSRWDDREVFGQ
jgi:hypothetical protein